MRVPLGVTRGSVEGLHYGLPPACWQLGLILSYSVVVLHQVFGNVIFDQHPHLGDHQGAFLRPRLLEELQALGRVPEAG